jgi:prepilin-type N-terminal cleavage/methylation domain-containing protein
MKNNKGFTLVELLAVIAILAMLAIITLPNVVSMFNEAKQNSFNTEVKNIYKTAQQKWMNDSMFKSDEKVYSRCKNGCTNPLDLSGRKEIDYYIKLNKSGNVIEYYVTDGTYQYSFNSPVGLKIENISSSQRITDVNDTEIVTIESSKPYVGGNIVISPKMLSIEVWGDDIKIIYMPGMTWRDWLESDYSTGHEFKIENRSVQTQFYGQIRDTFLENNAEGISTMEQAWYCGPDQYLTSYELLYIKSLNLFVSPDDPISSEYHYSTYSNMC